MPPRARVAVAAGTAVVAGVGLLTVRWFLAPAAPTVPATADAVVVLGGGHGERLARALELLRSDLTAPVLVVSTGPTAAMAAAGLRCGGRRDGTRVECVEPAPSTTRGEARLLGRLATQRGWRTVVLVTSSYHVTRAVTLVTQCVDARIVPVPAGLPTDPLRLARVVVQEWAGLAWAHTVGGRAC